MSEQPTIHELIERSSLGDPEAKAARARVSDEEIAPIMTRLRAARRRRGRVNDDQRWLLPGARVDTSSLLVRACQSCGGTRTTVDASGVTDCPHCDGTGIDPASLPPGAVVFQPLD